MKDGISNPTRNRFLGCLTGLALGDAVGCAVEFRARGKFEPLTDMIGGGKFQLEQGQWTDDTSMSLCLAHSLIEQGGFDAKDQMDRYIKWFDEGYMSCKSKGFGIGKQTARAIGRYIKSGDPFAGSDEPNQAGNGALMRIAPIPMYYFGNLELAREMGIKSSITTHGCSEVCDTSSLFVKMLFKALHGRSKDEILCSWVHTESQKIRSICLSDYKEKTEDEISSSGYVVNSLEAALWAFSSTNDFESAILKVANLGDDSDTTAAICGQLSGAYYGYDTLPKHWLVPLYKRDLIVDTADRLYQLNANVVYDFSEQFVGDSLEETLMSSY